MYKGKLEFPEEWRITPMMIIFLVRTMGPNGLSTTYNPKDSQKVRTFCTIE